MDKHLEHPFKAQLSVLVPQAIFQPLNLYPLLNLLKVVFGLAQQPVIWI